MACLERASGFLAKKGFIFQPGPDGNITSGTFKNPKTGEILDFAGMKKRIQDNDLLTKMIDNRLEMASEAYRKQQKAELQAQITAMQKSLREEKGKEKGEKQMTENEAIEYEKEKVAYKGFKQYIQPYEDSFISLKEKEKEGLFNAYNQLNAHMEMFNHGEIPENPTSEDFKKLKYIEDLWSNLSDQYGFDEEKFPSPVHTVFEKSKQIFDSDSAGKEMKRLLNVHDNLKQKLDENTLTKEEDELKEYEKKKKSYPQPYVPRAKTEEGIRAEV